MTASSTAGCALQADHVIARDGEHATVDDVRFTVPLLVGQLAAGTASSMPDVLANVVAGVGDEVGRTTVIAAMLAWVVAPATLGPLAVRQPEVV